MPARIPAHVRERVRELAVSTFKRTGCSGLARVDFFVGGETVLVNELNTMPGFTSHERVRGAVRRQRAPLPELLDRLLELALERHATERGGALGSLRAGHPVRLSVERELVQLHAVVRAEVGDPHR